MNAEDRRFWEGLPLSIIAGIVLWMLAVWWYCATYGPEAAVRNQSDNLNFCNSPVAKSDKQRASCDRLYRRLPCDTAEFNPDFSPAQREACRQLRIHKL